MLKRRLYVFAIVFIAISLLPTIAYANWATKAAETIILYILQSIFEPIFNVMVKALGDVLVVKDISEVKYVQDMMHYCQYIATSLLTLTVAFKLWRNSSAKLLVGQPEPISYILWNALIAGVLIFGLPELLKYMIRINGVLLDLIASLGISFDGSIKGMKFPVGLGLMTPIFFCIWIVALVGLTFSNAIRFAELCFLYVMAPIMSVNLASKGEQFQHWVVQAVAVTFTQSVQYFLAGLSLYYTVNMGTGENWYSWLLPVGGVVLAIRGPQLLKQLLYSTGVAGTTSSFVTQALSMAVTNKFTKLR